MFGLSFLNTIFLWGLTAAAIPVIIHLIKRNRAIKLPFAAMRFLQLEPNERYRSQKLKQLLLLLMRTAALALLALAFARPFMKHMQQKLIWSDQRQAAVVLIDNSYSMGFADNLQLAKQKAKDVVSTLSPGDEVTVMQFSDITEALASGKENFGGLNAQVEQRLHLSNRSTNYSQALQAAEALLLESSYPKKVIYVISDFQQNGWEDFYPGQTLQPGIQLEFLPIGTDGLFNVAVKDMTVAHVDKAKKRADVLARIVNDGSQSQKVRVTLSLNGRDTDSKSVRMQPFAEQIIEFRHVRLPKGEVRGSIGVNAAKDPIAADSKYYFVLENQREAQILAVGGTPPNRIHGRDGLFFVERAINLPEVARYHLKKISREQINQVDFNDYRAVLLANIKDLSRESIQRLQYYVRGGGGLLIALGDQVEPHIFNRLFKTLSPAEIHDHAFADIDHRQAAILAEIDYQHPIFRLFADPGQIDPATVEFFQYFVAEPFRKNYVLATFDDGNPAVLERKVGAGKVVLFTSSLETKWTNLPVKGLFLPLLYQTLDYVISEKKNQKSYIVGNPVAVRGLRGPGPKPDLEVVTPSGEEIALQSDIFAQTEAPGIYEVRRKGRRRAMAYFAVNVDVKSESQSAITSPDELDKKLQSLTVGGVRTAAISSVSQVEQQEKNQKLWRLFVLAVILLLLGETWLGNRTYR